jgi:hypothetical protein
VEISVNVRSAEKNNMCNLNPLPINSGASMILQCGCEANSQRVQHIDGKTVLTPSCVVHDCVAEMKIQPSLEGRRARCACGKTRDSNEDLAFFEYNGPESMSALETCVCGYFRCAHREGASTMACEEFKPRGDRVDSYYCGHAGWD